METTTPTPTPAGTRTIQINRPCYVLFLLAAVVFVFRNDLSQAAVFCGLALVFDPFDVKIPYPQRPFYQRAWLVVHLVASLTLLGLGVFG